MKDGDVWSHGERVASRLVEELVYVLTRPLREEAIVHIAEP